ncbi:MAG: hypothetical protein ACOX5R_17415 [bacterium]
MEAISYAANHETGIDIEIPDAGCVAPGFLFERRLAELNDREEERLPG